MKQVLCVGECMVELRHRDARSLELGYAGDTYNAAVYLRRVADALGLEVDVGYATGLGRDPYSAAMRATWREQGIIDRSVTIPDRVPGLYAIRTGSDGERSFTYWRGESAARAALADDGFWDGLHGDVIHLSGITLQLVPPAGREVLRDRLGRLRAAGSLVSFDTNYRPAGWPSAAEAAEAFARLGAEADIVFSGRDDESALHGEETPAQAIGRLAAGGAAEVVLRAGADGAYVGAGGGVEHIPAEPAPRVVDTTAAGDAAAGAYLAGRLAGRAPREAARLANAVAAVVVGHPGAVVAPDVVLVA